MCVRSEPNQTYGYCGFLLTTPGASRPYYPLLVGETWALRVKPPLSCRSLMEPGSLIPSGCGLVGLVEGLLFHVCAYVQKYVPGCICTYDSTGVHV